MFQKSCRNQLCQNLSVETGFETASGGNRGTYPRLDAWPDYGLPAGKNLLLNSLDKPMSILDEVLCILLPKIGNRLVVGSSFC